MRPESPYYDTMICPDMHIPFFGRETFYPNIFVYEILIFVYGFPYWSSV